MTRPLWLVMVRAAGLGRAALVAGCTAGVTGLLLLAVTLVRPGVYVDTLGVVFDDSTRPGVVLAAVLMTVPLLILLDQVVRLDSTARQRRHSTLMVAGATRRDLRRWGALEVGLPTLIGALAGVPVWWAMEGILGDGLRAVVGTGLLLDGVGPGAWTPLVLAVVAGLGLLVGERSAARAGRRLTVAAATVRPTRPWLGLTLLCASALCATVYVRGGGSGATWFPQAMTGLLAIGLVTLAPSMALLAAHVVRRRASSAPMLLASSRMCVDPGPAGRAAGAVGAAAIAAGVLPPFALGVLGSFGGGSQTDPSFYLAPAGLVLVCVVVVVAVVTTSLVIHAVESVLQRQREMTALVATGVPLTTLSRSMRMEAFLATLPLSVGGGLVGAIGYAALTQQGVRAAAAGIVGVGLLAALVLAAISLSSRMLQPYLDTMLVHGLRRD